VGQSSSLAIRQLVEHSSDIEVGLHDSRDLGRERSGADAIRRRSERHSVRGQWSVRSWDHVDAHAVL